MACYISIKVGLRTLIVVPTTSIKDQWADTLTRMFKVDPDRVTNVRSPKDFINVKSDFVVVSHATLASINKTYDLEKIMKANKFGYKIIDEVQMFFQNLIRIDGSSNICHNLYLTGTFGRSSDEENKIYQQMFGDLNIFREKEKSPSLFNRKPGNVYGMKPHMNVKMLWSHSGLSKPQIDKVCSGWRYSERGDKWQRIGIKIPEYTEMIIPSDGRMTLFLGKIIKAIKLAESEVTYGRTLILTSTIKSVEIVADHIRKLFPNKKVGTIHSQNNKADNVKAKAEADIMISTVSSAGTGFDAPGLAKLVMISPLRSWILTDQTSGRLRRRPDGKDTYMYDLVDADIKQLVSWSKCRAEVLKRKSKTFKVVDNF
jgi:superfamily II DNA or RNA helicase